MGDKRIVEDIKAKNEAALGYVINKYSKLLWKTAAGILAGFSTCEIEECVADVFIYIWEHPEKYDPAKGKLSSWLQTLAKNRAIDRFRRLSKEKEIPTDDLTSFAGKNGDVFVTAGQDETAKKLRQLVEELPDKEREVIVRRYYMEEKNTLIAENMGLKTKQVENLLFRAKQKLRRWLA